MSIVFIIFIYYKFRFDQINQQIKNILNEKVNKKRKTFHQFNIVVWKLNLTWLFNNNFN